MTAHSLTVKAAAAAALLAVAVLPACRAAQPAVPQPDSTAAAMPESPDADRAQRGRHGAGRPPAGENPLPYRFRPAQLIVPAALIGVGVIGLESDWPKFQNREIRDELQENIDRRFTIDDFTQYAPAAAVYGLGLCGVKGRHRMAEQTLLLGTAGLLTGAAVLTLKSVTGVERPDGSARNSFPSGHTATAFMGAELLRREYRDVSPWIGVAGYVVAAGTGFFRMYNNRHWLTDVLAGAGIGILSVQIAYWLYPLLTRTFFRRLYERNVCIAPSLANGGAGIGCSIAF